MSEEVQSREVRAIASECSLFEKTVLRLKLATEDEVRALRPSDSEQGAVEWARYLAKLHRLHAKYELQATGELEKAGASSAPNEDAIGLDMMANAPVPVSLGPGADGSPRVLALHQKSLTTLLWVHRQDKLLEWISAHIRLMAAIPVTEAKADHLETYSRLTDALSLEMAKMAWVLTSEGRGMPFRVEDRPTFDKIPPVIATLQPLEFLRVHATHMRVNFHNLEALRILANVETAAIDEKVEPVVPASWTIFVGAAAIEMGLRPQDLMTDWSLGELIAAHRMASAVKRANAEQARRAQKEARDKANQKQTETLT